LLDGLIGDEGVREKLLVMTAGENDVDRRVLRDPTHLSDIAAIVRG